MHVPWNDWYHCNGNTYGTWLPGDERGWRSRHHREHCEGDYKNPPPTERDAGLRAFVARAMKREPVSLDWRSRVIACNEMASTLQWHRIEVIAVAVTAIHFHALLKCPDRQPRKWLGIAKKNAARLLSDQGLAEVGGVWAKRFRCLPVKDRQHQANAAWYIINHVREEAAIWTIPRLLARVGERLRKSPRI